MRRPMLTVVASVLVLCAALAAPALAQRANFNTSVTIRFVDRPGPDLFRGHVDSPQPRCIENRVVRLFRVSPGPDTPIDFDRSEDNGSWSIDVEGDPAPGSYYVRVPARTVGGDTCGPARSRTIAVAG